MQGMVYLIPFLFQPKKKEFNGTPEPEPPLAKNFVNAVVFMAHIMPVF